MEPRVYQEMQQLENRHWWFLARRKIIATVISRLARGRRLNILDAGCGNGDNLAMLSQHGQVSAMEKDAEALKRAQERGICQVYACDLPAIIPQQVSGNYDLLVMLDVLEHIDEDRESLEKLRMQLADEGLLLLTVPAFPFLWSRHDELHHHKRRYTRQHLLDVLTDSGFEIEFATYFNTLLFPLALMDRMVKKLTANDDVMALPPDWLNTLLRKIFSLETAMVGKVYMPFGLSLIAVARKQAGH